MRGATLFFSALLVVVGTGRCVCLESNLNKALIVEEPVASCAAARKQPQQPSSIGKYLIVVCFSTIKNEKNIYLCEPGSIFSGSDTAFFY